MIMIIRQCKDFYGDIMALTERERENDSIPMSQGFAVLGAVYDQQVYARLRVPTV